MKRALLILSLTLAAVISIFWAILLQGEYFQAHHPLKFTPEGFPIATGEHPWFRQNYSIELPPHATIRLLLASDTRGIVFDLFLAQIPPERAPGPPGSDATQQWSKPRADRSAAAYARHLGFEKGIEFRHGQYLNNPIYFYGTDYYVAVPHLFLILICLAPGLWLSTRRAKTPKTPSAQTS